MAMARLECSSTFPLIHPRGGCFFPVLLQPQFATTEVWRGRHQICALAWASFASLTVSPTPLAAITSGSAPSSIPSSPAVDLEGMYTSSMRCWVVLGYRLFLVGLVPLDVRHRPVSWDSSTCGVKFFSIRRCCPAGPFSIKKATRV